MLLKLLTMLIMSMLLILFMLLLLFNIVNIVNIEINWQACIHLVATRRVLRLKTFWV